MIDLQLITDGIEGMLRRFAPGARCSPLPAGKLEARFQFGWPIEGESYRTIGEFYVTWLNYADEDGDPAWRPICGFTPYESSPLRYYSNVLLELLSVVNSHIEQWFFNNFETPDADRIHGTPPDDWPRDEVQ